VVPLPRCDGEQRPGARGRRCGVKPSSLHSIGTPARYTLRRALQSADTFRFRGKLSIISRIDPGWRFEKIFWENVISCNATAFPSCSFHWKVRRGSHSSYGGVGVLYMTCCVGCLIHRRLGRYAQHSIFSKSSRTADRARSLSGLVITAPLCWQAWTMCILPFHPLFLTGGLKYKEAHCTLHIAVPTKSNLTVRICANRTSRRRKIEDGGKR